MHNSQQTRQGNAPMIVMIFLIIFTVSFGVGAYFQEKAVKEQIKGDNAGKVKPSSSIIAIKDLIFKEQQKIETKQDEIRQLGLLTQYYNREIAALGEFYREPYTDSEGQVVPGKFIGIYERDPGEQIPATHHYHASKIIKHNHAVIELWQKHFDSPARKETPHLKAVTEKFREGTNEIDRQGGEAEDNILGTIDRLDEELSKLNTRLSELQKEYRNQWSIKQTRKIQLEAQIRRLLELELRWMTQLESDGEILQTGVDYNFIIVNIGMQQKVRPGMRFEIFNFDKGQYKRKGLCEVIKTDRSISTCRVIVEDNKKHNPIAIGDHIGNPVYDKLKPKTFVLAGEFNMYNKEDLTYFIERAGGKVSPTLKPGVDFLVASHRSDVAQDQAREYNVLAMDEATLVKYLDTTFSTAEEQSRKKK